MNILKAQQELLTGIVQNQRCFALKYDDKSVLISVNGYNGYLIPRSHLHVKIQEAELPKHFPGLDVINPDNVLTATGESCTGERAVIDKYLRADGSEIWINPKLLKNFKKPKLYQAPGDYTNIILVTEDDVLTGFVMPHLKPTPKGARG